jgi:hypothetical protein
MKLRLSASRPDLCAVFLLLGLVLPPAMAPLGTALAADMDKQTPSDSKAENPVPIDVGFWATSRARTDYEVVVVQYWSVGPLLRAEAVTRGQNMPEPSLPILVASVPSGCTCRKSLTRVERKFERTL